MAFLIQSGMFEGVEHVPGSPDQTLGNQFQSVCRCGHKAKAGSTPSAAYKNCQSHCEEVEAADRYSRMINAPLSDSTVEALNQRLASGDFPTRKVSTGSPATSERGVSPEARVTVPRSSRTPYRAGEKPSCRCACGERTGGGLFRPGHDAKFLSKLQSAVKNGVHTPEEALSQVAEMPKLHAKLASRLGT